MRTDIAAIRIYGDVDDYGESDGKRERKFTGVLQWWDDPGAGAGKYCAGADIGSGGDVGLQHERQPGEPECSAGRSDGGVSGAADAASAVQFEYHAVVYRIPIRLIVQFQPRHVDYAAGLERFDGNAEHSDASASGYADYGKHLEAAVLRAVADCSRVGIDRRIRKQPPAEEDCRDVPALRRARFALLPAIVQPRFDADASEWDAGGDVYDYGDGVFWNEFEESDDYAERAVEIANCRLPIFKCLIDIRESASRA